MATGGDKNLEPAPYDTSTPTKETELSEEASALDLQSPKKKKKKKKAKEANRNENEPSICTDPNRELLLYETAVGLIDLWETVSEAGKVVINVITSKNPTMTAEEVKLLEKGLLDPINVCKGKAKDIQSHMAAITNTLSSSSKKDFPVTGAKSKIKEIEPVIPVEADAATPVKAKKKKKKKKHAAQADVSTETLTGEENTSTQILEGSQQDVAESAEGSGNTPSLQENVSARRREYEDLDTDSSAIKYSLSNTDTGMSWHFNLVPSQSYSATPGADTKSCSGESRSKGKKRTSSQMEASDENGYNDFAQCIVPVSSSISSLTNLYQAALDLEDVKKQPPGLDTSFVTCPSCAASIRSVPKVEAWMERSTQPEDLIEFSSSDVAKDEEVPSCDPGETSLSLVLRLLHLISILFVVYLVVNNVGEAVSFVVKYIPLIALFLYIVVCSFVKKL